MAHRQQKLSTSHALLFCCVSSDPSQAEVGQKATEPGCLQPVGSGKKPGPGSGTQRGLCAHCDLGQVPRTSLSKNHRRYNLITREVMEQRRPTPPRSFVVCCRPGRTSHTCPCHSFWGHVARLSPFAGPAPASSPPAPGAGREVTQASQTLPPGPGLEITFPTDSQLAGEEPGGTLYI